MDVPPLLPVYTALGGVLVTGIVAEVRRWLDLRRDDRRLLRRVLNRQLQLWRAVRFSDPQMLIDHLAPIIQSQFGVTAVELQNELRDPTIRLFLRALFSKMAPDDLIAGYATVVEAAADADPLLAYRLSTQGFLRSYANNWRAAIASCLPSGDTVVDQPTTIGTVGSILDEVMRRKTREALEADMNDVARAIGISTLRALKKTVARAAAKLNADEIAEVSSMLQQMASSLGVPGAAPPNATVSTATSLK